MAKMALLAGSILAAVLFLGVRLSAYEEDVIKTSNGDLTITFIGHASLMFSFGGKVIQVDPTTQFGDYSRLPKADLILITHEHGDHFDPKAIDQTRTPKTEIVATTKCAEKFTAAVVMKNGDVRTFQGIEIEAVPAYNVVNVRSPGLPYHPKGDGNGYVLTFGDKRVYVAGDTESIPEMTRLKNIDVAFLPMNLPYTMTAEMVAHAAEIIKPKILYPYHYGDTDTSKLIALLKARKEIEIRIRKMN